MFEYPFQFNLTFYQLNLYYEHNSIMQFNFCQVFFLNLIYILLIFIDKSIIIV
nr:MAG TPA: hypothetical protein [Caudoviricetes sp.]